jgi:hypothetical protein
VNVSIPIEDDPEDIILNAHMGASTHDLMRRVGRSAAGQYDQGEERKGGRDLHRQCDDLGHSDYAPATDVCAGASVKGNPEHYKDRS